MRPVQSVKNTPIRFFCFYYFRSWYLVLYFLAFQLLGSWESFMQKVHDENWRKNHFPKLNISFSFNNIQVLGHGALYSIILYVWIFCVDLCMCNSILDIFTYRVACKAVLIRLAASLIPIWAEPCYHAGRHGASAWYFPPWNIFTRTQEYFHSDPRMFSLGPKNIFTQNQGYFHSDPGIFSLRLKNIF